MTALKAPVILEETAPTFHQAVRRGQILPWPDDVGRAGCGGYRRLYGQGTKCRPRFERLDSPRRRLLTLAKR